MSKDTLKQTCKVRDRAWASWGTVDPDVIAHLINPTLMGGPRWPGLRHAFHTVRRDGELLIASDGLADPFDEGEGPEDANGFGLEIFAVTSDPIAEAKNSWLFDMVWQMSQQAAANGQVAELLDELGVVSAELYDVGIPKKHARRFFNDANRVGVLLGLHAPPIPARIDGPLSPIRLVNIKLLSVRELAFAVNGGDKARVELARRFAATPTPLASSLTRPDAV
jgi:hypothetical protein